MSKHYKKQRRKQQELICDFLFFLALVFVFTPVIPFAILVLAFLYFVPLKESYFIGGGLVGIFVIVLFFKNIWGIFLADIGTVFTNVAKSMIARKHSTELACMEGLSHD